MEEIIDCAPFLPSFLLQLKVSASYPLPPGFLEKGGDQDHHHHQEATPTRITATIKDDKGSSSSGSGGGGGMDEDGGDVSMPVFDRPDECPPRTKPPVVITETLRTLNEMTMRFSHLDLEEARPAKSAGVVRQYDATQHDDGIFAPVQEMAQKKAPPPPPPPPPTLPSGGGLAASSGAGAAGGVQQQQQQQSLPPHYPPPPAQEDTTTTATPMESPSVLPSFGNWFPQEFSGISISSTDMVDLDVLDELFLDAGGDEGGGGEAAGPILEL